MSTQTTPQQIPLDLGYRSAMGRDNFLIAPSNQEAVKWIDKWPDWPAPCLVIYGPKACGKSHIASVWAEKNKARHINTQALSEHTADKLSKISDHLIIDRADFSIGDKTPETTLFHLYNMFKEEERSLLLTMHAPPSSLNFLIPDLASRLKAAPSVAIKAPDDDLLFCILVKLFSDRQLTVGEDILHYILPRMERSLAAAFDLVDQADHLALSEKRRITLPLIRQVLMNQSDLY